MAQLKTNELVKYYKNLPVFYQKKTHFIPFNVNSSIIRVRNDFYNTNYYLKAINFYKPL